MILQIRNILVRNILVKIQLIGEVGRKIVFIMINNKSINIKLDVNMRNMIY